MEPNFLLNILLQTHIQQTGLENPPFCFEVQFEPSTLDLEKYSLISKSKTELNKFVDECMNEFNLTYPNVPVGSVHLSPYVWTKFALKTIALGYKSKSSTLIFPNGCCSRGPACPINMYYLIVKKNIQITKTNEDEK